MSRFDFETTRQTQDFCNDIVIKLITLSGMTESDATKLINNVWKDLGAFNDDDPLLHETPYFHAMSMIHHPVFGDNCPEWWRDEKLWPEPPEKA